MYLTEDCSDDAALLPKTEHEGQMCGGLPYGIVAVANGYDVRVE